MSLEAETLDYQQRLAQLPPDVLPTMVFVAQLPGMGEIEHEERGYEKRRHWFGTTQINGEEILLGIASQDKDTDFLLVGRKAIELWRIEERSCNELTFKRKGAAFKSLLVDGEMEEPNENEFNIRYSSSLNFCNADNADGSFCSDCIFKEAKNEELRYARDGNLGFWRGTIRAGYVDPRDFPIRRASDIRKAKRELYSYQRGFPGKAADMSNLLNVMGQIRDGIINAEMVSNEDAVTMLPDVAYNIGDRFRDLRKK